MTGVQNDTIFCSRWAASLLPCALLQAEGIAVRAGGVNQSQRWCGPPFVWTNVKTLQPGFWLCLLTGCQDELLARGVVTMGVECPNNQQHHFSPPGVASIFYNSVSQEEHQLGHVFCIDSMHQLYMESCSQAWMSKYNLAVLFWELCVFVLHFVILIALPGGRFLLLWLAQLLPP